MTFEREFVESESSLDWDVNNAVMYSVVNKEATNKYGEYRGFKIMPGEPGRNHVLNTLTSVATGNRNYLQIENSSTLSNSANWATHHLYAAQRKDTEPHSASPYNTYDPAVPLVDFAKFIDGESLDQEDLVM